MIDFDKYRKHFNGHDHFSVANGIKLVELRERYAKAEMTVNENSMNYMGSVHGGLLYTMADITAGTALIYCGRECVTLSAYTDYVKAARSGKIIAEARETACGKTIGRCEVEIHDENGNTFCRSYITMFITDKKLLFPQQ